ncbi:MAG: 23S rRNA (guanosine(2251)-2'-O)-methyltransferase RlmB [Wenzhouxiangellaceae bacterium]
MKRAHTCGINPVAQLLSRSPERVLQLWVTRDRGRVAHLVEQARAHGIPVHDAHDSALERLAGDAAHQGVVAEIRSTGPLPESALDELLESAGPQALVLVLDQVQDPHNLGACLRSAAAAGACAVVIPAHRAAPLTPAARKSSAGAAEVVPVVQVGNLARAIDRLKRAGLWCIGLDGRSDQSLYATDLNRPLALVLGNEQTGLRRLTRERCDLVASIPMPGGFESLNVSVAAGIALFEAVRQRAISTEGGSAK